MRIYAVKGLMAIDPSGDNVNSVMEFQKLPAFQALCNSYQLK